MPAAIWAASFDVKGSRLVPVTQRSDVKFTGCLRLLKGVPDRDSAEGAGAGASTAGVGVGAETGESSADVSAAGAGTDGSPAGALACGAGGVRSAVGACNTLPAGASAEGACERVACADLGGGRCGSPVMMPNCCAVGYVPVALLGMADLHHQSCLSRLLLVGL